MIAVADLLIFLALTFVGDHSIGPVPSFMLVWLTLVCYRKITGATLGQKEFKLQQTLFLLLSPYVLYGIIHSDFYYYAFIYSVLYINVFTILKRLVNSQNVSLIIMCLFILVTVFVLSSASTLRTSVLFGPNILYRIYGVLFFIYFFHLLQQNARSGLYLLVIFILSTISLFSTGSRGATLIIILEMITVFYYFRRQKIVRIVLYSSASIFVYFVVQFWQIASAVIGRAVYFDLTNPSEATRISLYNQFNNFLQDEPIFSILFGLGNNNAYYPESYYPHNIIIEFIVYHGFIFFSFIAFASLLIVPSVLTKGEIRSLFLIFTPILLGAMVSGSYLDNYPIIALVFYCFAVIKFRTPLTFPDNHLKRVQY